MDGEVMSLEEILEDPYYLEQFNQRVVDMTDGSLKTAIDDSQKNGGKNMNGNEPIQNQTIQEPVAPDTQPQAVNVDIETILKQAEEKANEIADKKAKIVFENMIKQQNPNLDKKEIKKLIEQYETGKVNPEDTIKELQGKLEKEGQEKIALLKGVPLNSINEVEKEKAEACINLARTYVNEETTFDMAIDKALKVVSFEQPKIRPTPMYAGSGSTPVTATEAEVLQKQYNDAIKRGNKSEMVDLIGQAQKKGIVLY